MGITWREYLDLDDHQIYALSQEWKKKNDAENKEKEILQRERCEMWAALMAMIGNTAGGKKGGGTFKASDFYKPPGTANKPKPTLHDQLKIMYP